MRGVGRKPLYSLENSINFENFEDVSNLKSDKKLMNCQVTHIL